MDYGHPERADRLAAEYCLGTLRGPARRRFEALLPAHPALARATARWQARLAPLDRAVEPVAAPARVWTAIERRLFGAPAAAPRWWQRAAPWRAATVAALALGLALFAVRLPPLLQPGEAAPRLVLLAPQVALAGGQSAGFVASLSADGTALVLRPLRALDLGGQRT
ncbi:MAG: hypothetical protein KGJ30_16490, partial [Burkholderiales bacterium]|nr:hypothetical protein [Burkholderiales bacterium]